MIIATGQQWSKEQQEFLEYLRKCWEAWEEAKQKKDLDIWTRALRPDKEVVWWWANEGMPTGSLGNAFYKIITWSETPYRVFWSEIRPIHVKIHGDVALVFYYGIGEVQDKDGKLHVWESKFLEVFRKQDGLWTYLGGMVVPLPKDD